MNQAGGESRITTALTKFLIYKNVVASEHVELFLQHLRRSGSETDRRACEALIIELPSQPLDVLRLIFLLGLFLLKYTPGVPTNEVLKMLKNEPYVPELEDDFESNLSFWLLLLLVYYHRKRGTNE